MKPVKIGSLVESDGSLTLDIPILLKTRLVVQASSGGGKSYAIRKIIEETHGQVQQIIIDIEDDFSTLREKYDFVLCGKGGDIEAHPRTAELLARKVLELHADVIINLYELKMHERVRFVKLFLDAMIAAPKELWHPAMVILDEAHLFAPEGSKSESLSAVIDMASRGRKRGFCIIPATQRPAKLHKDVSAECQNKLIGLANQDLDRKRAAEEIGFVSKADTLQLRDLDAGEFFALGPAFGRGVRKVRIGKVSTTHHEAGRSLKTISKPKATGKVKEILSKLQDLPQEAEEELKTVQALSEKVKSLQRELSQQKVKVKVEVKKVLDPKALKLEARKIRLGMINAINKYFAAAEKNPEEVEIPVYGNFPSISEQRFGIDHSSASGSKFASKKAEVPKVIGHTKIGAPISSKGDTSFGKCERAILKFLAVRADGTFNKTQIGAMTEYSPTSGGFNNAISKLTKAGLICKMGNGSFNINGGQIEEVKQILGSDYLSPEPQALLGWLSKLGKCERQIFQTVKDSSDPVSKQELGEMTNYSATSGGFNNAISKLTTLGLIQKNSDGTIALNQELVGL